LVNRLTALSAHTAYIVP